MCTAGSATASGGTSRDALLTTLAADIDLRLPGVFDIEAVRYKYPVDYNESMNTGLHQSVSRCDMLLAGKAKCCCRWKLQLPAMQIVTVLMHCP